MNNNKYIFSWSGGKDSAFAYYLACKNNDWDIKSFLTSMSEDYERISMHGVRKDLLLTQCKNIGLPVTELILPTSSSMEIYEETMYKKMNEIKEQGITKVIFGDIFLEDLKAYRENQLKKVDMTAVFPLWKRDTKQLAKEFIDLGFKTIITCIDNNKLDESFVGRVYDEDFLNDLPKDVDPCGENGEFHTFVYDGPIFKEKVDFIIGDKTNRKYPSTSSDKTKEHSFWYVDLIKK